MTNFEKTMDILTNQWLNYRRAAEEGEKLIKTAKNRHNRKELEKLVNYNRQSAMTLMNLIITINKEVINWNEE